MPATDVLFVVVCGIGTFNSLFLASFLLATGKGERGLNRLLAALVLTFSLRVAKAVALLFGARLHPFFELLWIASLALTGVAALLYVRRSTGAAVPSARRLLAVLGGWLIAGSLLVFALPLGPTWRLMAAALVAYAACLSTAAWSLREWWPRADAVHRRWSAWVGGFLASNWTLYLALVLVRVAGPVAEDDFFKVEAIAFSLVVYAVVYIELRHGLVARVHQAGDRERVDGNDPMLQRLRRAVEDGRLFLDPSLSLPSLAGSLRLTPQHVSRLINAGIGCSFNDYLNRLRIEEACRILSAPDGASRKIGTLAGDCGFGSSSVFYAAFRKFTGQTPAEYQKQAARSNVP